MINKVHYFLFALLLSSLSLIPLTKTTLADDIDFLKRRPLTVGPHFPLHYSYTLYEPDSAYNLPAGKFLTTFSISQTNIYNESLNALSRDGEWQNNGPPRFKQCDYNPKVKSQYYWNCKSSGYSLFFDGEATVRTVRFFWGIHDRVELQFKYQDLRFSEGTMDSMIEQFHGLIGQPERNEKIAKNQFNFSLWDNQSETSLLQATAASSDFHRIAETIAIKLLLYEEKKRYAFSLKLASNFHDDFFKMIGEGDSKGNEDPHKEFDDYNLTLNFIAELERFTLHSAVSVTKIEKPFFPEAPDHLNFYFFGGNWHITDSVDLIIQDLIYTSIFPDDEKEPIVTEDLNELTVGGTWHIHNNFTLEFGFIENFIRMGTPSTDFTLFTNLLIAF